MIPGFVLLGALSFLGAGPDVATAGAVLFCLAFAWLAHRGVELPSIRLGKACARCVDALSRRGPAARARAAAVAAEGGQARRAA